MKQKKKQMQPRRLGIIPFILIAAIVLILMIFSLRGQKHMINSYLVSTKCREATIKADKLFEGLEANDYDRDKLQEISSQLQNENDGYIGIALKQDKEILNLAGAAMPEDMYEFRHLMPGEKYSLKNMDKFKYSRMGYFENSKSVYMDIHRCNWLYKGIKDDFSVGYSLEPLSGEEVTGIISLEAKENKIKGYQDIWIPYTSSQGEEIYIGYSVPMTNNDFQLCFIFAVGYSMASAVVLVIVLVVMLIAISSQHKVVAVYYTDKKTLGKNWSSFENRVTRMLRRMNKKAQYAMIKLSADNFDTYCLCYGDEEGDRLIRNFYQIMREYLPKKSYYARKEASDFGILVTYTDKLQLFDRVATLVNYLEIADYCSSITVSAGIYVIDSLEEISVADAYNYASIACVKAEGDSAAKIMFFSRKMKEDIQWERRLANDFQKAIDKREFEVYFQPKYDVSTEKPVAAEALIRWKHPTEGFLIPERFIHIFEKNGRILELDDYMLREIARIQSDRIESGRPIVPISVNISRLHFVDENLAQHIAKIVDDYSVPREYIELELTESAFFDDKHLLINTVRQLKQLDFTVSLDDFGAGYSSLNSIRELPIDTLKLDEVFFAKRDPSGKTRVIVKEIINLAKLLNLKVVAEGIEHPYQVEALAEMGCDQIQGYYYARPMPLDQFRELVDREFAQ